MTVGELVAFNAYLVMLAWPMIAFGWVTNLLQRGRASWGRMLEVMETIRRSTISRRRLSGPDARRISAATSSCAILSFAYGVAPVLERHAR